MPRAFSTEVTVDKSARVVWRALTNWMLAPKWIAGIKALIPNGATKVGTLLKFVGPDGGYNAEIQVCDKEEKLVLYSDQDGVFATYTYTLEALSDDKTKVSLDVDLDVTQGFLSKIPWLVRGMVWLSDSSQLKKLKKLIEK